MTLQANKLPPQGGSPRDVATAVNQALDGKLACVGTHSYGAAASTTTVTDTQVTAASAVLLVPTSADARDAKVAISDGQFVVTFASVTAAAGTLRYAVLG
jgi:hypothetical protein